MILNKIIRHKPVTRKFKNRKVYSGFKDNIWGADLADMQLIKTGLIKELGSYYVLLIFLVNMLGLFLSKIKKGISIVNAFQKILKESKRKPNKIWIDKESEFYNHSFKNG